MDLAHILTHVGAGLDGGLQHCDLLVIRLIWQVACLEHLTSMKGTLFHELNSQPCCELSSILPHMLT